MAQDFVIRSACFKQRLVKSLISVLLVTVQFLSLAHDLLFTNAVSIAQGMHPLLLQNHCFKYSFFIISYDVKEVKYCQVDFRFFGNEIAVCLQGSARTLAVRSQFDQRKPVSRNYLKFSA